MPTPAPWYAAAQAALERDNARPPAPKPPMECAACDGCGWYEGGEMLQTTCEVCNGTGIQPELPPLPRTPEEREAIPDYGDLASSVIWYPVYDTEAGIACRNCGFGFEQHDPDDGLCLGDRCEGGVCSAPDGHEDNVEACAKHGWGGDETGEAQEHNASYDW